MWIYTVLTTAPRMFWPLIRVGTSGRENVPARGPVIVATNHSSFIDPWVVAGLFPLQPVHYLVTARWYERSPFWSWFFDGQYCIPAALEDPIETIGRSVEALRRGATLGIFPEGRISYDGRIQRGRVGVGWAAALTGVPVVPAALRGSFEILPRTRRLPRPGRIELRIGTPLSFPGAPTEAPDPGQVRDFVGDLMAAICRLAGQEEKIEPSRPRVALDLSPQLAVWFAGREERTPR